MPYADVTDDFDPSVPLAAKLAKAELMINYMVYGTEDCPFGLPAYKAHKAAGYKCKNHYAGSSEVLTSPRVRARLQYLQKLKSQAAALHSFNLQQRLEAIASIDLFDYFKIEDGQVLLREGLTEPPKEVAWMVQQIKPTKYGPALEFISKDFAMRMLNDLSEGKKVTMADIPTEVTFKIGKS